MKRHLLLEWITNATLQADILHLAVTDMAEGEQSDERERLEKAAVAIHEAKGRYIMALKALE